MRIYPAVHYTMGGLWVDYHLQSNIPGLFVLGEANFSDHGANRLGASALMQGLADGYFVIPYTIGDYLARGGIAKVGTDHAEFKTSEKAVQDREKKFLSIGGKHSADWFHKKLGEIMWENVGMARSKESLEKALKEIPVLREQFWKDLRVPGSGADFNQELEKAGRVADFLELGELLSWDALQRNESCGGHFRTEYQTDEGEALRNDAEYAYAAAWEWTGENKPWTLNKEPLVFENIHLQTRSYK
jgi:succinate dehydrogenase / fumarate reductase flavoprotein subunit